MNLISRLSLSVLALLSLLTSLPFAAAQEQKQDTRFGSINIEGEGTKRDAYGEAQDKAIEFFKGLAAQTAQMAQGALPSPLAVPDDVLQFLEGVFLFCSVRTGACPLVLEGLLEVDVINSRINRNPQCPTLIKFWKSWSANEYETRLEYSLQTGLLETSAKFKNEVRPKFIRCQETVRQEVTGSSDQAVYFKDRYREGSRPGVVAAKLTSFLEALRNKTPKINVFVATGVLSTAGVLPRTREGDRPSTPISDEVTDKKLAPAKKPASSGQPARKRQ